MKAVFFVTIALLIVSTSARAYRILNASAISHDYGLHLDVSRDYKKSSDFSESLPFEPLAEKEMERDEGEGHSNGRCPPVCLPGGGGRAGRK